MHTYLLPVVASFKQHAQKTSKAWSEKYLLHQFTFFGVKAPVWRSILKKHFKNSLPPFDEAEEIIHQCFSYPMREMQYTGIELLAQYKKEWKKNSIDLIEHTLITKSWWDSVDHSTSILCAPYFRQYPDQIRRVTSKWNLSNNYWLQRCSILFQLKYKSETDTELLFSYILNLKNSKEFFVQKAIGWALREYSKTNPSQVKHFLSTTQLPTLCKREAMRYIQKTKS
jgi:3-methyladenine DNA glycosylase AlkD